MNKWVVDTQFPQGHLVPLTPEEQAQYDADQIAGAAWAAQSATFQANAQTMRASLRAHYIDALALADKIDANTATAAEQRAALSLCIRGTVRLARLMLEDWDVAA